MIEIFAQVVDPQTLPDPTSQDRAVRKRRPMASRLAQVLCLEPANSRSKQIPDGARAVLPKPSGQDFLVMMTSVIGLTVAQDKKGWGSYLVGAGRGSMGISCRMADGTQCPQPDFKSIIENLLKAASP